jgi:hypothetical protein
VILRHYNIASMGCKKIIVDPNKRLSLDWLAKNGLHKALIHTAGPKRIIPTLDLETTTTAEILMMRRAVLGATQPMLTKDGIIAL